MSKKTRVLAICLSALFFVLPFTGCASCQNKKVVATCGEYDIYYEYLRFVTLNFKAELDSIYGGTDDDYVSIWNKTFGDGNGVERTIWDDPETAQQYLPLLEEKVWGLIADNYAVLAACAEYGVGRDVFDGKEIEEAVDEQMDALIATYDSYIEYEAALEASYLNEDVFRFHFAIEEMKVRLYQAMASANDFIKTESAFYTWLTEGNYAYVHHVMREVSEGEDAEAELFFATEIRNGLINGTYDLNWYINNMNDDLTNTTAYFIIRHAYDDALVDAALALKESGELVSPVIESNGNYYVLVLADEADGDLAANLTSLLSTYQWGVISEKVAKVKKDLKIELTDYGKSIDLLEIK